MFVTNAFVELTEGEFGKEPPKPMALRLEAIEAVTTYGTGCQVWTRAGDVFMVLEGYQQVEQAMRRAAQAQAANGGKGNRR